MIVSLCAITGAATIFETTPRACAIEIFWRANAAEIFRRANAAEIFWRANAAEIFRRANALVADRAQGHSSGHDEDNAESSQGESAADVFGC